MNRFSMLASMAVAVLAVAPVRAEDAPAADAKPAEVKRPAAKQVAFSSLPRCSRAEGLAEVQKPMGDWQPIEENKYYPLGSSFRTGAGGSLELSFGEESVAVIRDGSAFGTLDQAYGLPSRTLILQSGTLELKLPDNLPVGALFVTARGFTVKNPAGESRYVLEPTMDGEKAIVRCVTGTLAVDGRHFAIPEMRAADEVVIRSSHDFLSTELFGTSGDYVVKIDQGIRSKDIIDDNGNRKTVSEPAVTDWHLSPSTRVLINRSLPAIGSRMSVVTMAFDAAGERKSECNFCEGRAEVNSGELVVKEKTDGEELAKRAAEAAETTESAEEEETSEAGEKDNNNNNNTEKSEEE